MFVWLFHRITGVIMIVLIGLKIITGYYLPVEDPNPVSDFMKYLHASPYLDSILVVAVIFHALYGLRTILYDLGIKKEKMLLWSANIAGLILSAVAIAYLFVD